MMKNFKVSLGVIPTSYLKSMTYAEMVTWLCNYLDNNVIAKINEIIESLDEIGTDFDNFKEYVDSEISNLKDYTDDKISSEINDLKSYVDGIVGDIESILERIDIGSGV